MAAILPLDDQLAVIKKLIGALLILSLVLALLVALALASNLRLAGRVSEVAAQQRIFVIPGAAEGVYAPGLTEHNLRNAARYLTSLFANLTPANAAGRLEELEGRCSPAFLPKFQAEQARLAKEIADQMQSRALQPDPGETLNRDAQGRYTYSVSGVWEIRSGSLAMSALPHRFTLVFAVGNADKERPDGIELHGIDVTPLAESGGSAGAADAAPLRAGAHPRAQPNDPPQR